MAYEIKETTHIACPYCENDAGFSLWCNDIDHEPFFDDFMIGYVGCDMCGKDFKVYFSVTEIEYEVNDE